MKLHIAWHNILHRPFQSGLLVAITALAVALSVCILLLNNGFNKGLIAATEPFDILAGAKGSANQLVLNTVFLQDKPTGNLPYSVLGDLRKNPGVERAVPLAFGDNYHGCRIVGTEDAIFEQRIDDRHPHWLQMAEGRPFAAPFEAVIGASAAAQLHLRPGDTFVSIHGTTAVKGHAHENAPYTVVGILAPVNGPYDQAILTDIRSIWQAHSQHEPGGESAVENGHNNITAVMVKPKGYADALRLYQQFQKRTDLQMVFPAQIIVQLFALLGQGEKIWQIIGTVIIAVSTLIVALSMYWSGLSRLREQAVLRSLGAAKHEIFTLACLENSLIVCFGSLSGWLLGETAYLLIRHALATTTAVAMTGDFYAPAAAVAGIAAIIGILLSLLPAAKTSQQDIAKYL